MTAPAQIIPETTDTRDIDPFLAAVRLYIADNATLSNGTDWSEWTRDNVVVTDPEDSPQTIDTKIATAVANNSGLCLLIVPGGGKNPDPEAPGPQMTVDMELQLYAHPATRASGGKKALALVVNLMRGLHDAQVRVTGYAWYEEIRAMGFSPLPDPDYIAYAIDFERDMRF